MLKTVVLSLGMLVILSIVLRAVIALISPTL